MTDAREALAQARRWVTQEGIWDDNLALSVSPGISKPAIQDPKPAAIAPAPVPASASPTPKATALQALYETYKDCTRCPLGPTRIKFVFGVGNPDAEVMFIGEGPGYEEDRRGEPFVGKAGQLLDKILGAIDLSREKVYIANIVKCHPMVNPSQPEMRGNDRPPSPDEAATCSPILQQQIAIIQPRIIVTLGSPSSKAMLLTTDGITKLRGHLAPFPADRLMTAPEIAPADREALSQTQVLPTYHPAALLRNPDLKKEVWEDMKLLRDLLKV